MTALTAAAWGLKVLPHPVPYRAFLSAFPAEHAPPPLRPQIVVLSPDAEEPLLPQGGAPLDPGAVYLVGGIVDRTPRRGLTLQYAVQLRGGWGLTLQLWGR